MNESQQLRESMWDLVYGLLSAEESKALIARIKSDPQAARLYAEVRLQADLVGQAARVGDSSIVLKGEGTGQPAAVSRPKAAAPSHTAAKPAARETYHRGGAWLAGIAATALAALLAVGFFWPRQNQAVLAGKFLVTEVMSQRSLPAGVTGQVAIRTARIDTNGEPAEGCQADIELRLLDRGGQEQFRKSVQTNEIGLANVEIPGNVLEPGVRLEVAQRTQKAKESDRDQSGRARGWARGSQETQDATVTVELPVEPEPQVAYFLVGEPTVEPGKSVPVSVWNFDAFSGKPEPVESLKALESLSDVAQQTTVENSQSGVVNGVVQWKDNVPRQSSTLQLGKQQMPSEAKPVQGERAANSSQATVNRRVQSFGFLPPGTGGQQARARLQQAQQLGRELRDQTNAQRTVAAGQPISVSIPSELAGKPVLAAAICRGVTVATATASGAKSQAAAGFAKKSDGSTLSLDLPPEADGLIEVALFDRSSSEEIPVVREMVYREPLRKLQIELPDVKSRYAPGEAVQLTLRVSDEQGRAAADTRLGVRVWNENVVEQSGERPVLLADAMRNSIGQAANVMAGESLSQTSDGIALAGQRRANDEKLEVSEGQKATLADAEPQAAAPIALPERIELVSNRGAVKAAFRAGATAAEAKRQRMLEAIGGAAVFGAVGVLLLVGMLCVLRLATSVRSIAPAILVAGASILIGLSWLGWMPQPAFVHHGQIAMAPAAPAPAAESKNETAATNESTAMGTAESSRPAADSLPLPPAPVAAPAGAPAPNEPPVAAGRLGDRGEGGAVKAQPEPGFGARAAGGGLAAADKKEEEKVGVSAGGAPAAAAVLREPAAATDPAARALPTLQRAADAPVLELRVESRGANQPSALSGNPLSGPAANQAVTAAPAALYFNAELLTDAAGRATIEFVMPPVESNYRLLVDALGQGRIGSQEQILTCGGTATGAK